MRCKRLIFRFAVSSSSRLLMGTLRSVNALLLGAGCYMVFGYVHTADNPADAPSRWGAK